MKRELWKSILIRIAVVIPVFIISVIGAEIYFNKNDVVTAQEMKSATFPIVFLKVEDEKVNPLFGYEKEMKVNTIRDSITPLAQDRKLSIAIETFGNDVTDLSYEILTTDGEESVEEKNVVKFQTDEEILTAELEIDNHMRMNQEYILKLEVGQDQRKTYYYTRILQEEKLNADKYIGFLNTFYQLCTNKESKEEIQVYIDTNEKDADTSFQHVTINSSVEKFMWSMEDGMQVQVSRKPVPVIKEINPVTASATLDYEVVVTLEDGSKKRYDVKEFYRMRYDENRVKLLDFERKVESIFEPMEETTQEDTFSIGMVSQEPYYMASEENKTVAFVRNGQLWSYNHEGGKLTKVFSFRGQENSTDLRYRNEQYGIQLLKVEDEGGMDFLVYGYMNRGDHEGNVGVGVYHLTGETNEIEEKIFINTDESYDMLKIEVGKISYASSSNMFYLLLGQDVHQINMTEHTDTVLASDLESGDYAFSVEAASFVCTKENSKRNSKTIEWYDLESGESIEIESPEDSYLRPLGFFGKDLIYGLAKKDMVDQESSDLFLMDEIIILSKDQEVAKQKSYTDKYVSKVEFRDGLVELTIVEKGTDGYQEKEIEQIVARGEEGEPNVTLVEQDYQKSKDSVLHFPKKSKKKSLKSFQAKLLTVTTPDEIHIAVDRMREHQYYVYSYGQLSKEYFDITQAIQAADTEVGVVVNNRMQMVWERGNLKEKAQIPLESVPEFMKAGSFDENGLQENIDGTVINLTGCTLQEALYYVSTGVPVWAYTSQEVVTIVGFDGYNTILYHPSTGEAGYKGIQDSTKLFEENGNQFITYIESIKK